MRLMMIAPELSGPEQARSFSSVWSWFLARELRSRGEELVFDRPVHLSGSAREAVRHYARLDVDGIDHIVALGTRYFERIPPECGRSLMRRCRGAVAQVHDSGRPAASCDLTFTLRNDRLDDRNRYIGWAADGDLIRPAQEPGVLRILIDHPDYSRTRSTDRSREIVEQCLAFQKSDAWRGRYESVSIRRMTDGGVEEVTPATRVSEYDRGSLPFPEIVAEYSRATLFMVTHPESVGMSVLETAMAGALPVVPVGFIQKDRLATIRSFPLRDVEDIPWLEIMDAIDVQASRAVAMESSWGRVVDRMLLVLRNFRRRKTH